MMSRRDSVSSIMEDVREPEFSSSPLRRKSIAPKQILPSLALVENDDEAERLARRRDLQQRQNQFRLNTSLSSEKRRSLGLGLVAQMPAPKITEHISQCIKLSAENKINMKNAFSLEMINFMTYMIKKKDANMTNFQVASTSLDVSAKIYGYRVDGMHTDILKMMGGSSKQNNKEEESKNGEDANDDFQGDNVQKEQKKKKKKKQDILSNVESLNGIIEVGNPTLLRIGEGDTQTTDKLYQAMLPFHANSGYYIHPYNDVIVDTKKDDSKEAQKDPIKVPLQKYEDFSNLEICPAFANFQFLGWFSEDQSEEEMVERNESNFQFDLEAYLPPDNDNLVESHKSYIHTEEEIENLNMCAQRNNQTENIVDFCNIVTIAGQNRTFEYSYIQKSIAIHWAGPMYWKTKSLPKSLGNSKVMEACRHEAAKKRKELELCYSDEIENACKEKFATGQAVKLQAKTARISWQEENVTLPRDVHYDIHQMSTLYYRTDIILNPFEKNDMNTTQLSDNVASYNYDNENDKSNYCPNINTEDYQGNDVDCNNEGDFHFDNECGLSTQALTGDNLVTAPTLVNKIFIPYSLRAKRIDMYQLKKCIWKLLTKTEHNKENIDIREAIEQQMDNKITKDSNFSKVYKELPKLLSKSNSEALSVSIALISLLHLANEKMLDIHSTEDMSDLIISQS